MSRAVDRTSVGIEGAQLGRVVRPAQRGEWPQAGGEPRVQHVGIALPALALGRLEPDVGLLAAVPDRDLVPPPELARDAPGRMFGQPLEIAPALALGLDLHAAVLHRRRRPARPASSMRMNHCREISGSIRSPERCEYGTLCV